MACNKTKPMKTTSPHNPPSIVNVLCNSYEFVTFFKMLEIAPSRLADE